MKRLLLVFTAFLGMIGLVGCDLISPEVVEQVSEQYCRDNPTADICQGESVGELQESAVIDVFNTLLDEYNDPDNTTFCEDYFSVTNIELLDECRASRSELFPEDLTGWTIDSATRQGALSTQSIYDVVVISPNGLTTYTFEVGLIMVEGIMYVEYWDYTVETIDPATLDVVIADAIALFQQFLGDYTDDGIDSTTFCSTYDPASTYTGCATERDDYLADNLAFTYTTLTEDSDSYKGEVTYTSGASNGNGIILVDIYYDDTGTLVLQLEDILLEEVHTDTDYLEFVTNLFEDFFGSTRSAEDVCSEYFVTEQYDFCMDGHAQKETDGYTQEVVTLVPFEDHYILTINTLVDGTIEGTMELKVYFFDTNEGLKIQIDPGSGNEDNEYVDFITNLVADYQDDTIASETICSQYFLTEDPSECIQERDEFIDSGTIITLLDVYFDELIQEWVFEAEFDDGTTIETDTQLVMFVRDENDQLKIKWDDGGSVDDYQLFYQFLSDFVADYQDDTITSDVVCNTYFGPMEASGCIADREESLLGTTTIEFVDLYIDEFGQWIFHVKFIDGTIVEEEHVPVDFYFDENNDLKLYMLGDHHNQEYFEFLQDFIEDYQDSTLDSLTVCQTYLAEEDFTKCAEDRDQFLADGITATLLEFYPVEDDLWEFKLEMTDGTNTETIHQKVMFIYDQDNNLKLVMKDHQGDEYETYLALLEQFFFDYGDANKTSDYICNTYFEEGPNDDCINNREEFITAGGTALLLELYRNEYGMWEFRAEIYDGTSTEEIVQTIEFIWDHNNMLRFRFIEMDPNMEIFKQLVQDMINDFQDASIPTVDVCTTYFMQDDIDGCTEERDNNYDFSYTITLDGFWPHGDGRFGIELIYNNGTEDYRERMIVDFFDDNGVWKLSLEPDPMMFFENYIHQFVNDMQDSNITNDDFCNYYFEGDVANECVNERVDYLDNYIIFIQQFYPMMDGIWYLELEFTSSSEYFMVVEYIYFYENEFGDIKLQYVIDESDLEQAMQVFQSFVDQINDPNTSTTDLCNTFFMGDEVNQCIDKVDQIDPGYMLELVDMYPLTDGRFKVSVRFLEENVADPMDYMEDWIVTIYQDSLGHWKLSMIDAYHPGQEFNNYTIEFVTSFNNPDVSLDAVCNMYFSPESVQECLNIFDMFQGYTMEWIDFYPIENGDFMLRLRLDDGTQPVDIDLPVGFYYDEFGTLWMHPSMHEPGVDFETAQAFLDQFVVSFNDSSVSNTDFAVLLDTNSQWIIPDFRQMALDNGLTIVYYWLYHNMGHYQFEFELSDGSMHLFDVMFHDYDGVLVAELWYPIPPVTEDQAWSWVNSVFEDINNGVDTNTICSTYFGAVSQHRCNEEINHWRTNNELVAPTALYGHDKWDLTLTFTYPDNHTEEHSWGLAFFFDENGVLKADFLSAVEPGDPITWNDAEAFIGGVVQAINDGEQVPTICMNMFAQESYDECYLLFEMIVNSGATIRNVYTHDMIDYWEFELELVNSDGVSEFVSLNTVLYFYQTDYIKGKLTEPTDTISEDMKLSLLYDFLTDFNEGTMTSSMLCQTYFASDSTAECDELYQYVDVANTTNTLDYWFVDFRHHPHYLELAIREDGMNALEFISFDVSFTVESDGSIQFSFSDGFYYTYGDETLALASIQDMIADFNDSTVTTDMFCNMWSNLFDTCTSIRDEAINNVETMVLVGLYPREHHSFTARLELQSAGGTRLYDIFIEFRLVIDREGYLNIWGWNERLDTPTYDDATVQTVFETFMSDFFDDTISDDDFSFQYDYVWIPGLGYRQDMLDRGLSVTVVDTYIIHVQGDYQEYEAEILVTEGLDQTTYYLRFNVMEDWDNQLIPAIFFPEVHLTKDEREAFINTFLSDIQNLTYTNDVLCDKYFGPWEDWLCEALRTLIVEEGQTLTLTEITVMEWDNYFVVVLSNGLEITLGVDHNFDLFGHRYLTVFYHIPFELWDAADESFYTMIETWEGSQISLSDLCQEIDCSDILNDQKSVQTIFVEEHHFHPDYWMQYAFYAEIKIHFTDGTYQYVQLRGFVDYDANGEYVFTYKVIGEELAIPFDQTQLYDTDIVTVLNAFLTDMLDDTVDAQTLCNTYFGTQMRSLDCIEGRQMYLDNNYTITLLPLEDGVDEIGNSIDIATFEFNDGTTTVEMSIGVRVYDYGDGTYYIWFVDDATVIAAS